ncbi:SAM-dependent methyltransferase [Trebonia kvetii]|uniref:SAM-dependent methyltransferase n=1 Tax=Trebonia kvetii TaxID=2480626 RepID=A0A6P2BSB5_9ACTN|nr:SAM-dependent methyltransferase [Trebonia kvetii]TVZ01126.1 SAM-dependent methyltransferase [Trebonia kvetii]
MAANDDWRREPTAYQVRSVVRTIDPSIAHIARVQDYWLGGKDHFEADRIAGDEVIALLPDTVASVRQNRAFLGRTVRFLAGEAGIRQFLDLGTGMPTASNTHEVAQARAPESKIAYVDNDPMVLAHARALLTSRPEGQCAYIDADIRDPETILGKAAEILDFSEPVAVVLMAVLQFIPDEDDPQGLVRRLVEAVPAGSCLVISHPASDIQAAAMASATTRLNQLMAQRAKPRSRDAVTAFFDGLDLVEPGVIRCPEWRPDRPEDAAGKSTMWGGVAKKPGGAGQPAPSSPV